MKAQAPRAKLARVGQRKSFAEHAIVFDRSKRRSPALAILHEPSNAVVHLQMRRGNLSLAVGAGVLYRRNQRIYIVTAWHNLTGRHVETLEPASAKYASEPDNVVANIPRLLLRGDEEQGYGRIPATIPLEDDTKGLYLIHPTAFPRVDVVAIPVDVQNGYAFEGESSTGQNFVLAPSALEMTVPAPGLSYKLKCIQDFENPALVDPRNQAYAGDDLFILGYPRGVTDRHTQPIWKRATVASSPHLGWQGQEKFLVDCASREGMSGAPAVFYRRSANLSITTPAGVQPIGRGPHTVFRGIYTSRLGGSSEFEAQIGTVWHREVADQIIDGGVYACKSLDLFLGQRDLVEVVRQTWRDDIADNYPNKLLNKTTYLDGYIRSVLVKIDGRAKPRDVEEAILELAKEKMQ